MAHALDLVGQRWSLLIMRELIFGPKRFSDLRTSLPGISANLLTQRLAELEEFKITRQRRLPPPASSNIYELTPWGQESEAMIKELGRWGARSPLIGDGNPMSVSSLLLSLRTMFDADRAKTMECVIGLRFGEEAFVANVANGAFSVSRVDVATGDAVISCNQNVLASVVYEDVSLNDLLAQGEIAIEGSKALVRRFVKLFPLPRKA